MAATPRTASRNSRRNTAAPKLTPRGVRVVTALVFATATVAVALWGAVPVALACVIAYVVKRADVVKTAPSQRTVLRGLAWGAAGVALLMALSSPTAPGGATLGVALSAALGSYLYLTRRTK